MNPTLEPPLYAAGLIIFIVFLTLFPKHARKLPNVHPLFFFLVVCVEYLLFSTPAVQKQMIDFGIAAVYITPFSLFVSLTILVILAFMPIPRWLVTAAIIPLTFYVGQIAYYDATHFIGPIHDLLMGKLPLSTPSWYGLLPIVGLSLIFRIVPLTLVNLYVVIAAIETLGYILVYQFVLRMFKDLRWANLTIALIILFHFLVQIVDRNFYLQSTFIRFGIWVPLAVAVVSKKHWAIMVSLLLALFWTTDMGLYIVGAYIATLLITRKPLWPVIRIILPAAIALAFLKNYWAFSLSYGSIPMFATPIPYSLFPWLYLAIPILTLLFVREPIIVFLSLLSLFMFTYFTGHSHLNSLRTINIPLIIITLWWLAKIPRAVSVLMLILPIAIWGNQAVVNLTKGNIVTTVSIINNPPVTERTVVGNVALPEHYRNNFAIISPWDSYYLLIWNTTNALGSNCLLCYWTPTMAKPLIETAKNLTVRYLLVDRERNGYEGRVSWIFTPEVEKRYRFVETIGNLDVYERI